MKSVHKYAAERKKCKEIIGKRVCAKEVTTLFCVSYYPVFKFTAQLGAFSFGNRTKFSENGRVHDVTFEGTFV